MHQGAAPNPAISRPNNIPGDWGRIEFTPSSDDTSLINYAVIRYGGDAFGSDPRYAGNIYLDDASPTIQNTILEFSSTDGIHTDAGSGPILVCNSIQDNNDFGIRNVTPGTIINATNQYWGSPSGPYHPTLNPTGLGNEVSDGVSFIPWNTQPCGAPITPYLFVNFPVVHNNIGY